MEYRRLGKTDIEVSAVAFGCWAIVGGFNWGPQDERDSIFVVLHYKIAALRAAREAGVTFFDTAEIYGEGALVVQHYEEAETFEAIARVREIAARLGEPMADVALAWLLAQEGVASVLAGGRDAEQARANARAGGLTLPPDAVEALSAATEPLKRKLGPNADMWQSESRIR